MDHQAPSLVHLHQAPQEDVSSFVVKADRASAHTTSRYVVVASDVLNPQGTGQDAPLESAPSSNRLGAIRGPVWCEQMGVGY